jgi:hypothetical protein
MRLARRGYLTVSRRGRTHSEDGNLCVPKKDLVATLLSLLGSRRLQIASSLPEAAVLLKERQTFRLKITRPANDTYEPWREGKHDDLVLAVALAAWVGEHTFVGPWEFRPNPGTRSLMSRIPADVWAFPERDEDDLDSAPDPGW